MPRVLSRSGALPAKHAEDGAELETTNEELQSTSEELETMNDELRIRTDELTRVNTVFQAVLGHLRMDVVVIDRELRVQAWSEAATELWEIRPDEVDGAHFLNLDIGLPVAQLSQPICETLTSGEPQEVTLEAHDRRGRAMRCCVRATPLDGSQDGGEGIMLTMEANEAPE